MVPSTFQALAVILLAIVPGFIATNFWLHTKTWKGRGPDLQTVLQSLAVSLLIQAIMAPVTIVWLYPVRNKLEQHPWWVAGWAGLVVLIVPCLGGILLGRLADIIFDPQTLSTNGGVRRGLAWFFRPSPPPTIWDWLFTSQVPSGSYIVVEFDNGRRIAGTFEAGAVAMTSPEPQGLFLPREWSVDSNGDLLQEVPGSGGVTLIGTSTVRSIRILRGTP